MSTKSLKDKLSRAQSVPIGFDPPMPKVEFKLGGSFRVLAINENSAPLEKLVGVGRMETRDDKPGQALLRTSVATRLRDTFAGAQLTNLKSPELEPSTGGGGLRPVADFTIDSMKALDRVRSALSKANFHILEDFCHKDVFLWRGLKKQHENAVILRIHRALDEAGVVLGMMDAHSVKTRWARLPTSKPDPKPNA